MKTVVVIIIIIIKYSGTNKKKYVNIVDFYLDNKTSLDIKKVNI